MSGENAARRRRLYRWQRAGHIRSFVLRQGRVSNAQQRYYEDMMPKIGIPYAAARSTSTPCSADRHRNLGSAAEWARPRQRLPPPIPETTTSVWRYTSGVAAR